MKAISIKNPYANLIALGEKTLEVRSLPTHYRGSIVICASKVPYPGTFVDFEIYKRADAYSLFRKNNGMAIGKAAITDCRPMRAADEKAAMVPFDPNKFVYEIKYFEAFATPFPVKGQLGLFTIPYALLSAVV